MHPGPDHASRPRTGSLLVAAALGAALLGLGVHLGLTGPARTLAIMAGTSALTFLAMLGSGWRALHGGREAVGWRLLTASLLVSVFVQASRLLAAAGFALPGTTSGLSLLLPFLATCIQAGTLLLWNLAPQSRNDRIRHGLDGLLFALAIFFILWGLVLGPAFLSDRFPLAERLMYLATFLIYDLLLGLAVYLGLPEPSRFRGPLGWLTAAFLLACLHNFYWLLDALSGVPLQEFPRIPPFIFFIPVAYLGAALSPRPVGSTPETDSTPTRFVHLLPYLPLLGATALGVWLLINGADSGHRLILVWLALGLVLVLLIRQYLALRDVSRLSQHLETRVAERTRALEQAQALLLRTERMNSLATLGAGLAHDMNNMLSAIQGRTDLVIMDLDEGKLPNRKDLARIQEATQAAAALGQRLMALGRQEPEPPHELDLGEELRAIQPLLHVLLPRNQTLRLEGSGPMPFLGTRGMLEQILVNLVGNARDAMPKGGIVTLRARAPQPGEGPAGPILEVQDTGSGIPEDQQAQVFQPFFTTKPAGIGTGLGLASVKSLLEKAGGAIRFTSRPGEGTTFQVRLPHAPAKG